jgi:signal transduction histidine kinase
MPIELHINNIAFGITGVICLALGILVYVRRPKENALVNKVFILNSLAVCIWQASYVIGVNLHDPLWSRFAFMFNLAILFVPLMNTHLLLAITGRLHKSKHFLAVLYAIAIGFVIFFAFNPDTFLLPSVPQMYLANFFVPGPLYPVQDTFFFFLVIYLLVTMIHSYHTADVQMRSRLKYLIGGFVYGYLVGLSPELLLYGIQFDPLISSLMGLYTIPLAYAILKYEVIDINIIAKRALIYALGTAGITLFILFIGYANDWIALFIPGFPQWLLPLLSGILGVMVGVFIWKKIQEVDYLKFQFVDVVTHKFRTPLTHIKWSAEVLRAETDPQGRAEAVATIEDANVRLFEMTNSLIGLSRSDESQYQYTYASENIVDMLNETLAAIENQIKTKKIRMVLHIAEHLPHVYIDRNRVQFVMQMIIENAVIYSQQGSRVEVSLEQRKTFLYLSVRDTGIGISSEDMPHLFSRFFRAANAAETHTEGLGIGLFVSRDIMKRHGGDLWAESAGLGKGSTFYMKIPVEK